MTMLGDISEKCQRRLSQMAVASLQRVMTSRACRQAVLVSDPNQRVAANQFREKRLSLKDFAFADAAEVRFHSKTLNNPDE
jgi:hypothetical protein